MSENLKFYKGLEANLPTSGIEIGALYHCTDTGNTYRGVTSTEMQLFSTTNSESDWNANENEIGYIKNRTHWVEDGPGEPIFENINIEANGKWYIPSESYYSPLTLVQGDIYIVVNNIYERVEGRWFEEWTEENQVTPNGSCWTKSLNIVEDAGGYGYITNNTDQDIIVSIYYAIPVYHRLNKNFLPDNLNIPVKSGENETSLIGNDLENNITLGEYTSVFGNENVAGAKAFFIRNIDTVNKKIHLWIPDEYDSSITPTFETNYDSGLYTLDLSGYEVGDYIDITAYGHYHWILCTTIAEIGKDYIIYNSDIDDSANKLTTGSGTPYYFSVPNKPLVGEVIFTSNSFVEGRNNIGAGQFTHTEGYGNIATGRYSHAEGYNNISGYGAHAEGNLTKAIGFQSHAEGFNTQALKSSAHSEGFETIANGRAAHAEGEKTNAPGDAAHAEGYNTKATGNYAHAEGQGTEATKPRAHAEGFKTKALFNDTHAEGFGTQAGTATSGQGAHAEGYGTIADRNWQHVQGQYNETGNYAHIVGNGSGEDVYDKEGNLITKNRSNAHTLDWSGNAWFAGNVKVGVDQDLLVSEANLSSVLDSYATTSYVDTEISKIGDVNIDLTDYATKEYVNSSYTIAGKASGSTIGEKATAEGQNTTASGKRSHAEGINTKALYNDTHAEGFGTQAGTASGGQGAHAEGYGTIADRNWQHVQGQYNETGNYAHIVGNGNADKRSNAHTLDWNGNAWFKGDVYVGGTAQTSTATQVKNNVWLSPKLPKLFYGTAAPENDFGANGDIYIMIEE